MSLCKCSSLLLYVRLHHSCTSCVRQRHWPNLGQHSCQKDKKKRGKRRRRATGTEPEIYDRPKNHTSPRPISNTSQARSVKGGTCQKIGSRVVALQDRKTRSLGRCPGSSPLFGKQRETGQTTRPDRRAGQRHQAPGPPTGQPRKQTVERQPPRQPGSFLLVDVRSSGASQLQEQGTGGTSTLFTSFFERFSGRRPQHVVALDVIPDARRDNTDT